MPPRKRTGDTPDSQPESPANLRVIDVDGTQVAVYDPEATALWARLTEPFPADWVEKLPKPLKSKDDNKGRCEPPRGDGQNYYSADGHYCGGWHARSVHLDYVGHAGITMRLNSVLGPGGWDFQPYARTESGIPAMTQGQFYASLTILGVTKWDLAANFQGPQEAYGDALRRCAMRFGIGTYLWSKSDKALALAAGAEAPPEPPVPTGAPNAETNPELYAPNGQPWMTAEGKPNPDALAPHQRKVWDGISTLVGDEPGQYNAWHQSEGLPPLRAMDEYQAAAAQSKLQELVGQRPPA